jgi:hypothetical protein
MSSSLLVDDILACKDESSFVELLRSLICEERRAFGSALADKRLVPLLPRLCSPLIELIDDPIVKTLENYEEFLVCCCETVKRFDFCAAPFLIHYSLRCVC